MKKNAIIPQSEIGWDEQTWQQQLQSAVRDIKTLCQLLQLDPDKLGISSLAAQAFPLRVPRQFIQLMAIDRPDDPLLKQILNVKSETLTTPGYSLDPLAESDYQPVAGVIHKYQKRLLVMVSGACAIHCRYCFRRHYPYEDNIPSRSHWQRVINHIAGETEINEVIFSGGDPLMAPDRHLSWLCEQLGNIKTLKRLRIHTRLPVVIPQRICDELLNWVSQSKLRIQVVLHINHPNEISNSLSDAVARLRSLGVWVFNQAVLLREVNDSADTLVALHEQCFDADIQPYYLHQLDPVQGAAHFQVDDAQAQAIMQEVKARLPGYLVPKFVREIPGQPNKTLIA